jgi:acyl carrier protein
MMQKLHAMLSKVLDIPENEIQDHLTPNDVPGWDSFNALILVSELEAGFKVKFSYPEVTGVKCIGDIKTILRNHGVLLE